MATVNGKRTVLGAGLMSGPNMNIVKMSEDVIRKYMEGSQQSRSTRLAYDYDFYGMTIRLFIRGRINTIG